MLHWLLVLLLATTPNPCVKCHKDLVTGRSVHKVVQSCDDCHEATDKHKFVSLSDEDIIDQCTTCHDEIQPRHPPDDVLCTNCHDPHASPNSRLLLDPVPELCTTCHDVNLNPLNGHPPFMEGDCLDCHVPHGNQRKAFLDEDIPDLCFECHDDIQALVTGPVPHPPAEDECLECHSPHGSSFPRLLKAYISLRFYNQFTPLRYQLCFRCHERTDVFGADSEFKKGGKNLHRVHVQRAKGRSCLVCHNVHGSTQEHLLNTRVPFGQYWYFPIRVKEQNHQKQCLPACHQAETYGQ